MSVAPAETWIFGYGSLMWNPGFVFAEMRPARLTGYHRAFCIYSVHYRGTLRQPGLVLGLDRGGVCDGIAFRIAPERHAETLAYLRRRELIYGVYREMLAPVALAHGGDEDPRTVRAVTYIAERAHPAYAGVLPLFTEAHLIRRSAGTGGTNLDYLASTLRHLRTLGISEPRLERTATLVGALAVRGGGTPPGGRSPTAALTRAWAARGLATPRTVRDNRFGYRAKRD